jgi:hypothetical protein
MCVILVFIEFYAVIVNTHSQKNMPVRVMIIYLVYEHNMIVIVHINMMWPKINEPSWRRSYVKIVMHFWIGRG